jgi:NTE family protein
VPGVIAPAEIDGRLLVDGGLTNNLPVDVARTMGADVIIAVNLGTPLLKREDIVSVRGVAAQMLNILIEQNVHASLASLEPTDILIEPDLGRVTAADFEQMPKTLPIGAAAVRAVAHRLAALALPPAEYAELRSHQRATATGDTRPVAEVRFNPMERVSGDALAPLLETRAGEPLDAAALDRDMRRLYGTGDFEHVGYRVLDEEGRRIVQIEAIEKSWGPNYLRFGLGLGADLQGETFFNVAASYRRTWVNSLGAEWRTDLQLGNTNRLTSEFYQPFETRRFFFVAPRIELERRNFDVFSDADRIARYDVRSTDVALDLGTELTRYGELRVGVLFGGLRYSLDTGPQALAPPTSRIKRGAFTARAIFDQLDSANFPRSGVAASAHLFNSSRSLGAHDAYTKWDADMLAAASAGRHTVHFAAKAGGALGGSALPAYDLFQWGGFLHQSGYPMGALIGERLAFGRVGYAYKIVEQKLFEGLYAGVSLEAGRMQRPLVPGTNDGWLKSSALYIGMDTIVGPLYLGYGWAADGNRSAYLYLGRP